MKNSTVYNCSVVDLSQVHTNAGNISVVENDNNIPFKIKRIYYLYDIPEGESRGGHAHYELEQYIIAVNGSFDVILDDGVNKKIFCLNRPFIALHVVPGIWRELDNFSSCSICMVLASNKYLESDYIRNYKKFLDLKL